MLNRGRAEGIPHGFPDGRHADYPAEALPVDDGLVDVQTGGDGEEDSEEDSCAKGGAVVIVDIWVRLSYPRLDPGF